MNKTKSMLTTFFWMQLIVPAIIYAYCDIFMGDISVFFDICPENVSYVIQTVMILVTLALVPLALKLFKFKRIHEDLILDPPAGLAKWGTMRIVILGDLLLVNTILYYTFAWEPTYGYLSLIVLLSMPFIYPTMNRCLDETDDDLEYDEEEEEEDEQA